MPAAEAHFICLECLAGHVGAAIEHLQLDAFRQKGGVCCVDPGCEAPPFADNVLAKALPQQSFANYLKAKETIAEQRINAELEQGFEQRLEVERKKAEETAEVGGRRRRYKNHILENILTLSCPRCKQVFVDFNGCWALYCGRAGCGCGFCAICQQDCGHDAHRHIGGQCKMLDQIRNEGYHGQEWEEVSNRAKVIRLKEYLASMEKAAREDVVLDCRHELNDLGIPMDDLLKHAREAREPIFRLF